MSIYEQMRQGFSEATAHMRVADSMSNQFASMLSGRLRHVSAWELKKLKKELQEFNAHTGRWKS